MLVYYMGIGNILQSFGIIYGHFVILWQFGIFSLVLVYCVKKNLATLTMSTLRTLPFRLSSDVI
jgi:hypothetical protein